MHVDLRSFDGLWCTGDTTVAISRNAIWHNGTSVGDFRQVSAKKCVLSSEDDDTSGFLSADTQRICWADGDSWERTNESSKDEHEDLVSEIVEIADDNVDLMNLTPSAADATNALFAHSASQLNAAFRGGLSADVDVDPIELWQFMQWDPQWQGDRPYTSLLVATILLVWPEGVDICVRHGADVNATYSGPLRSPGQEITVSIMPILRVALSVEGPAQALICQAILEGKVRARTYNSIKKKAKGEMEFATIGVFDNWFGPFL